MRYLRRTVLWGLSTVLTLILILIGVVGALLGTESGTRWLIQQAEYLAPVELRVERVEGTLFTDLRLYKLHLALPDGPVIDLEQGRIATSAPGLLRGELHLRRLAATGLRVDLPPPSPDEPPATDPFALPKAVRLPIAVRIGRLQVDDLEILQAGAPVTSITRVRARARAGGSRLELNHLELDMPELRARLTGTIEADGDYPLDLRGHWQVALPTATAAGLDADTARGELTVTGALRERLQLEHDLHAGMDLHLQASARDLFATPKVELVAQWQPFTYHLKPEQRLAAEAGRLDLQGTPEDWTLTLETAAQLDPWPRLALNARAHGDLEALELDTLAVDSAAGQIALAGPVRYAETLAWDLTLTAADLDAGALGLEVDAGLERLRAHLRGTLPRAEDAPALAALEVQATIDELIGHFEDHAITGSLIARLANGDARLENTRLTVGDAAQLNVTGSATGLDGDLADPEQRAVFDLALELQAPELAQLHPELADLEGGIERLRLALEGDFAPATGALDARLDLDPLRAGLQGVGITGDAQVIFTEHDAHIKRLRLATEAGARLVLSGDLDASSGLAWDLALEGKGLDPSLFAAQMPGQLELSLASQGHIDAEGRPQLRAHLQRLEGTLREQPVSGQGRLQLAGEMLKLEQLDLALGRNTVAASGEWAETLDFQLRLDAPDLDRAWPDLAGRMELEARLTGDPDRPRLRARGTGSGLRFADLALAQLELDANAGLDQGAPTAIDLRLAGLEPADGVHVERLHLDASGRIDAHRINLVIAAGELGSADLALQGGLDSTALQWQGKIMTLDLDQPEAGSWSLTRPAALEVAPQRARMERLCLLRAQGELCAEGDWTAADGGRFSASLDAVDLAWLDPFLPPELAIDGALDANTSGRVDATGALVADVTVTPHDGHLLVRDMDGEVRKVPYRDVRVSARVRERNIDATLQLDFLEGGIARSEVRLRPDGNALRIDGDLVARLEELAWIAALSPEIQDLRGKLDARLDLGGLLTAPLVEGQVRLREGGVLIPEAGIDVRIPEFSADVVSAKQLMLAGTLESGPGQIDLQGRIDLGEAGPRAELRLIGEDFLVVNRADAEARITPDIELGFNPADGVRVRGEVFLPWARLRPPDLPPGAVGVSDDTVIVDDGSEEEAQAQGLKTDIRIRARLGDDVRFDGFGLTARFAGEVDVEEVTGRPTQLFGEIRIPEGQYTDYGQDLQVERGRLVFQGPATSPELDLRAVRTVPDHEVTVGLEISGTPDDLRSRVVSTPTMDETEAMAFLLTGRPLAGASESDGNLIASAATAYGLEQGALITERIGRELGLDEVELDAEGGLDASALRLGLWLSPRLLLRYSIGLFDNTSRVLLRYELTENLSVETSSGATEQTIDLIYRLER